MKRQKFTTTIRLSAAAWTVTVAGIGTFDLRAMTRQERGKFHGTFMSAYRKSVGRI